MKTIKTFDEAYKGICGDDESVEQLASISSASNALLIAIATGKVDAVEIAKAALACRGIVYNGSEESGTWAGFDNAKAFWKNY